MKKLINAVFVIVSILCLSLPLIFMNRQKNYVSEIDNRMLAEMPELFSADFPKKVDKYLQDRIGFRDQMVNTYDRLNDVAFNELSHPLYDYGRDGYVFFGMRNSLTYGDYHEQFAQAMLRVQQYCEQRGVKFYLMFDPQKESIYSQYLPVGVKRNTDWVKKLLGRFDELGVNYIDFTPLLKEKSKTEQVFNVQYDAGHWNDLGNFYGAQALIERMRADFPKLDPLEKSQFEITAEVQTALRQSEFAIHEETPVFKLKSKVEDLSSLYKNDLKINSQYNIFFYHKNELKEAAGYPKVLSFQGSYWNRGKQFLASRTSSYIGVHNYQNIFNIEYYLNLFQPDAVVLDVAEYVMTDYYFSYDGLQNKRYSPAIIDKSRPLEAQVEKLLQNATKYDREQKIDRIIGEGINRLNVIQKFSDGQYMYAILGNQVYDLKQNTEDGQWSVSVDHKAQIPDTGWLYIVTKQGYKLYAPLRLAKSEQSLEKPSKTSKGVKTTKTGYSLETEVPGNHFNLLRLSLYDVSEHPQRTMLHEYKEVGDQQGYYVHSLPSGHYQLQVKANSNLSDESLYFELDLTQGEEYRFSVSVKELGDKKIEIEDLKFEHLK